MIRKELLALGAVAVASTLHAAPITWGTVDFLDEASDISNPAGSALHLAADFNTAAGAGAGDDGLINGIPFETVDQDIVGLLTTDMANGPAYNATFVGADTDDFDLDALLDSHSWKGGNPATANITIEGLTVGLTYQVQLITVGDDRGCCASRTYEPDDGTGIYSGNELMSRGNHDTLIGSFIADADTQLIQLRSLDEAGGNNDPGLSGLVVLRLASDDSDGDGLFNVWEEANGLNPNVKDSDGNGTEDGQEDGDNDELNNLGEQAAGTDPTDDDTDDDGYLDGHETGTKTWVSTTNTGTSPTNDDSDNDGLKDGVENPDLPFVDENQTGSDPNRNDSDDDTLLDAFEVAIGLSPGLGDTDGNGTPDDLEDSDDDGSLNFDEQDRGTDPTDKDSDDDGYEDGAEDGAGIWFSVDATGTDPLDDDTDNDGLKDGVENPDLPFVDENQTGTDPTLVDSDGDFVPDGAEVLTHGTNPTDINSKPTGITTIAPIDGLLGGDLTDPEDDGLEDITDFGPPQTAGLDFNWVSIFASSEEYFGDFGGSEGAFDIFDNVVGAGQAKWCCNAPPQWAIVEFENPVSITHFTITSGNDTPTRDPVDWQILGSNDDITYTPIFTHTGSSLWTARNQTLVVELATPSPAYKFIQYEVTLTGGASNQHQLNEIEYFGTAGGPPATSDFRILSITYDDTLDEYTITWTSELERTYTVEYSFDGKSYIGDVGDSLPSGGATSSHSFSPPPGSSTVLFRVRDDTP